MTEWTRPGRLLRPAMWDGTPTPWRSCRKGEDLVQSAWPHLDSDRGATQRKLEGGRGASSAKGDSFLRQRLVFFAHEVDHEISAEVGPEDAETVLVDPYDDNGAADSPGEETPLASRATTEAASVEATATTEAADAKKNGNVGSIFASHSAGAAEERHHLGVGRCVDSSMGRMDHEDGPQRPNGGRESLDFVFSN